MGKIFTRKRLLTALGVLVGGAVLLLAYLFWPLGPGWSPYPMSSTPLSYEAAVAGLQKIVDETPANIREDARPRYFVHGAPTDRVYVLIHGLSNNPKQFEKFGKELFDRGANVVIPRLPYHGEKNRLATDWARLSRQQMVDNAAEAIQLARGLGRHVTVAGLSISGTTAAWLAQNRADVDRTVLMAPFFSPAGVPDFAVTPITRIVLGLPNFFIWWNPQLKENLPGPDYVYPRFPTHIIGQTMHLGGEVIRDAKAQSPRSPEILVITTASDMAGNNGLTQRMADLWTAREGKVRTYQFPAEDKVPHDFIDPNQPDERTSLVYPKLLELLEPSAPAQVPANP